MTDKSLTPDDYSLDAESQAILSGVLTNSGWETLKEAIASVRRQVDRGEGDRRAVQLQFPLDLIEAIDSAAKSSGRSKIGVLIEAVREYRARYPIPVEWVEHQTVWEARPERRKSKTVTLRFPEQDRELIRNIGRGRKGVSDRYSAFLEVAAIIQEMHAPDDPNQQQISVLLPNEIASDLAISANVTKRTPSSILRDALRRCASKAIEPGESSTSQAEGAASTHND